MILPKKILANYQPMLNDSARNAWYKKHIDNLAAGKTFIDVGAGTGILSAYALEAGATHVHAIEINKEISTVGKHILKNLGYQHRFNWLVGDFRQVKITAADVIIAEQVGPGLFDEIQIDIWQHYNKIFGKNYISIPDELAVDLHIYQGNEAVMIDWPIRDSDTMPSGFYNELEKICLKPDKIIENFISIKQCASSFSIEQVLDLNSNKPATLVFVNKIGYQNDYLYINSSQTQNWRFPPRLMISDCTRPLCISWNPDLSNNENPCDSMYKGYWSSKPIL